MIRHNLRKAINLISLIGITSIFSGSAPAQIYGPSPAPPPPASPPAPPPSPTPPTGGGMSGGGTGGGGMTGGPIYGGRGGGGSSSTPNSSGVPNYHIGFDRPEAWALKYFASATLLSGLWPPDPPEQRRFGAVTLGLEVDWLPTLDAGQQRVGFNGPAPEGLGPSR